MNKEVAYCKAIGIMSMVLGHCSCNIPYITQTIYMFHMPLFFFFSGFCFKTDYLNNPKIFLCRRIKGLYWPFIKWGLPFLCLHNFFYAINIYNSQYGYEGSVSHLYEMKETLWKGFLIVTSMRGEEQLLGGYWFLNALFWGALIAFCTLFLSGSLKKSFCKSKKYHIMIDISSIFGLVLSAAILSHYYIQIPHLNIGARPFMVASFFYMGYIFKSYQIPAFGWWITLIATLIVFVGGFLWRMPIGAQFYETRQILPYFFTAILGIWSVYSIVKKKLSEGGAICRTMSFIGTHTLDILTWHFLSFKIVSLCIIFIYDLPIARLAEFPVIVEYAKLGWWIVYFTVGIIVPLLPAQIKYRITHHS